MSKWMFTAQTCLTTNRSCARVYGVRGHGLVGFQSALKEKEEARGSWGKKPWLWGGKRALSATGSKREEIQAWIPPELKLIPFLGPFREIPSSSRPVLGGCGAFDGQLQNMASAAAQYIFMSCFKMTFLGKVSPAGASRSILKWAVEGGLSTWQGGVGLYSSHEGHSCSLFHTLVTLTPWGTVDAGLRHSGSRLPSGQTIKNDNHLVPRKSSADGVLTGCLSLCPVVPRGQGRAIFSHSQEAPRGQAPPEALSPWGPCALPQEATLLTLVKGWVRPFPMAHEVLRQKLAGHPGWLNHLPQPPSGGTL